jgi:hypothetical protein
MSALAIDLAHPRKWFNMLAFLLSVHGPALSAMIRRSQAAGNPPPRFELLVSYQVTGALLRGHQLAALADYDVDEDDGDDELVLA